MRERIIKLRKRLKMSQTEFGKRIGLTVSSVSSIEVGSRESQERHIKLILSAFPQVSESWLRKGQGAMFDSDNGRDLDQIIQDLSFSEVCAKLLYAFDKLAPDQQEAVMVYTRTFVSSMVLDDPAKVAEEIAAPSEEDEARQALAQRLKTEISPTSSEESPETA